MAIMYKYKYRTLLCVFTCFTERTVDSSLQTQDSRRKFETRFCEAILNTELTRIGAVFEQTVQLMIEDQRKGEFAVIPTFVNTR